jgi:hypothetical protein
VSAVVARFRAVGVTCEAVGELTDTSRLELFCEQERAVYWDLENAPLTGFGA